jgi:predicted amidohydrolase YtcJ
MEPLRSRLSLAVALLLLLPFTACQQDAELEGVGSGVESVEPADLVLTGGKIVTVDTNNPEAEAVAMRGELIIAIGSVVDIAAFIGEATEVIELEGRLAIPGFIEGHGHFMGLGDARIQLDLRQAANWAEIVAMVEDAANGAAPGEWIRGRGWHQEKWTAVPEPHVEGFPVHGALSAISPENPVLLTHASGHALFANRKAMELAEVAPSTPDPQGGEILKNAAGEPTGLFRETAQDLIHRVRGEGPAEAEQAKMAALAAQECLAKGVTSFQDAGSSFATIDFLRQQVAHGVTLPRLWMMVRASNEDLRQKLGTVVAATKDDKKLRVGGIKLSIDGALGARGAWLLKPYRDSPGSTGLNLVPLEVIAETSEIAIAEGVQLCIHAIGDRANREVLNLYQGVFEAHSDKDDLRWRIEHAQHLHPEDIPRFAELGVVASMQAVHCTSDGPWVPSRLGDQRSEEGAYMWRQLIDSGALVTNGTDTPVEDVSPIASYYSSVSRLLPDGSRFYPDQVMSRTEALENYTLSVAKAAFDEDDKGSLEVGKLADIVVLSKDILTVAEEEIPSTEVVYTILGGEVVYARGGE